MYKILHIPTLTFIPDDTRPLPILMAIHDFKQVGFRSSTPRLFKSRLSASTWLVQNLGFPKQTNKFEIVAITKIKKVSRTNRTINLINPRNIKHQISLYSSNLNNDYFNSLDYQMDLLMTIDDYIV